ncbi:TKL/TKL-ccin protein kinase [Lyophyllum atratum]|nr:TKL/TKL-ccin protein kinase [Lyophyllum atratum]
MDVDASTADGTASEGSEAEAEEQIEEEELLSDQGEEDDSTDDHLLNSAQPKQLSRLRKRDLIRLYGLAQLSDDAEALTKADIISAIISARDDFASLPPSSPPGRGDGYSSAGCSSDDGNVAGDEETDAGGRASGSGLPIGHMGLRRRATMEFIEAHEGPKRRSSHRTPSRTSTSTSIPSPPATRLRSRKFSTSSVPCISTPVAKTSRTKGKARQVEFSDDVVAVKPLSKRIREKTQEREREKEAAMLKAEESDLTELEDLEAELGRPSPRRLRSKDREAERDKAGELKKTPMRAAKVKIATLKESDEEAEEEVSIGSEEEEDELCDEDAEGEVDEDAAEEDEVDELVSSASVTPIATPPLVFRGRRTPLRTRLRPRRRPAPPPSDGDDEGEDIDEEEAEEEVEDDGEEAEGEEAEEEEGAGGGTEEEDDEETIAVEPRKLRNGKIVGEEDVDMEEDIGEEDEEDEAEEDGDGEEGDDADPEEVEGDETAEDIDLDAEGEVEEDEAMEDEDDVDLTVATAKTLVRLRRDDLVRLCESRDLEPVGTKPQLAEALLQWRDRQSNDFSSPSSCNTVRPSSNSKRRRRNGKKSSDSSVPVLLRSEHLHKDEPITPVPTAQQKEKDRLEKEPDQELELDLESLGLEDREIPPEKIQKLEKIGSGGFKDVFIGKFKGRKIAISEFRGQLSAMDIKELKLLGGFDHPNIVRFLGVSIPENTRETPVMIVSELCSNGDLFDYVRNVNPPSLHKVLVMMLDVARGLEYLHLRKPSVIHRDCKSSNILITAKGTAKIADFGLAKVKQSTRSMVRSLVGTVNWQAPELWHAHPKYNHKVDVFSCAMVYWEMLQWHLPNKKFPWEGMNEHAIYEIVGAKRQRPSVSGLRKQWCPEIVDLIERMWAQEHQDRPTMSEVVEALEDLVAHR